jgi:hypothetical protein
MRSAVPILHLFCEAMSCARHDFSNIFSIQLWHQFPSTPPNNSPFLFVPSLKYPSSILSAPSIPLRSYIPLLSCLLSSYLLSFPLTPFIFSSIHPPPNSFTRNPLHSPSPLLSPPTLLSPPIPSYRIPRLFRLPLRVPLSAGAKTLLRRLVRNRGQDESHSAAGVS